MHCGQPHWSSKCKSISIPPEGFSKENGGGGHDHGDDEDDSIAITLDEKAVLKALWSLHAVQNGSRGDGPPSKQRVPTPWNRMFPSTPSSVAV
jgi:hypothetical protein